MICDCSIHTAIAGVHQPYPLLSACKLVIYVAFYVNDGNRERRLVSLSLSNFVRSVDIDNDEHCRLDLVMDYEALLDEPRFQGELSSQAEYLA